MPGALWTSKGPASQRGLQSPYSAQPLTFKRVTLFISKTKSRPIFLFLGALGVLANLGADLTLAIEPSLLVPLVSLVVQIPRRRTFTKFPFDSRRLLGYN